MSCKLGKQRVCCTTIAGLSVKAGNNYILKDINLHLHCGELTAIVGKNGAGKSTFMKALLGVIPHAGTVSFESGKPVSFNVPSRKIFSAKKKPVFGYVPQSLAVEPGTPLSVADLVQACTSKKPAWLGQNKKDKENIKEILSSTNAQGLLEKKVGDLSGGELQRVMLALAIHPLPDILLLDEPVSGVDREGLKNFYALVSSLRRNFDITILLVSHDLDLVAQHADRVVFIHNTSAVVGSVKEVYAREEFLEAFGNIAYAQKEDSK